MSMDNMEDMKNIDLDSLLRAIAVVMLRPREQGDKWDFNENVYDKEHYELRMLLDQQQN